MAWLMSTPPPSASHVPRQGSEVKYAASRPRRRATLAKTGVPMRPFRIASRARCDASQNRRWKRPPKVTSADSVASIMWSASASESEMGFSHSTFRPWRAAATTVASWEGWGVHTVTVSTPERMRSAALS